MGYKKKYDERLMDEEKRQTKSLKKIKSRENVLVFEVHEKKVMEMYQLDRK